jgi:WD40 repeat protein
MQSALVLSAGGTVQASGGTYIKRPADDELFQLCMEGTYAHVLTSRQMGKSSLRVAVSERLRGEGIHVAAIDLTSIGTQADAEQWYVSVLEKIEQDLQLSTPVLDWWEAHAHLTPTRNFTRYLLDIALNQKIGRIVIFIDEIDSTLKLPFRDDFFAAIRWFHSARADTLDAQRLSFVLIGASNPGDLIQDRSRTPFNVSRSVTLTDFSESDAEPLVEAVVGPNSDGSRLLRRIFEWTEGHPYLTQRLCLAAASNGGAQAHVESLVREIFLGSGDKKDPNLEWVRDMLTNGAPDREAVLMTWLDVLRRGKVLDEEVSLAKSHLKLAGVIRTNNGLLRPRNRIYREAFGQMWVTFHISRELERQRRLVRYKRIAIVAGTAALLFAVFVATMGLLLQRARKADAQATLERDKARAAQRESEIQRNQALREQERTELALAEARRERAIAQKEQQRAERASFEAKVRQLAATAEYLYVRPGQLMSGSLLALISAQRLGLAENRNVLASALTIAGRPLHRLEHEDGADAVALSPDGKWLATALGGTVHLWDAATGHERARLQHQGVVLAVAMSPDGKWLATTSADETVHVSAVHVWDLTTGSERARLSQPANFAFFANITALAISPDSKWLAYSASDNTVRVWDVRTGRECARLQHEHRVTAIAISPNSSWLATTSWDTTARLWDLATGHERARLQHPTYVTAVAISPDGTWLATGGADGMVRLWDLASGRERARLQHQDSVKGVAISPDGAWLATASVDKTARIWDAATGRERVRLQHQSQVDALAISPDGTWLATVSGKLVHLWDAASGRERARLERDPSKYGLAISPDSKWLAIAGSDNRTPTMWGSTAGRERVRLQQQAYVYHMAISPDGKWLATASDKAVTIVKPDGKEAYADVNAVHLWDLVTRRERAELEDQGKIYDLAISPDAKWLVTRSARAVRIWDAATGHERVRLQHQSSNVCTVAISPDGKWLATTSDKAVHLWDALTGRERVRLMHDSHVCTVTISPDSTWLATASDKAVHLWDAATGRERARLQHQADVYHMAISPDGKWLATASDKTVHLWDAGTGRERARLQHQNSVSIVAISPDGKRVATATLDNAAHLWDVATCRERARLPHEGEISVVAFSPDGKWLSTTGEDKAVRLWDAANGEEYLRLSYDESIEGLAFLPGRQDLIVAHGHDVGIEPWRTEDLVTDLCTRMTRNLTITEWKQYLGNEPYQRACPHLPYPEDNPRSTRR